MAQHRASLASSPPHAPITARGSPSRRGKPSIEDASSCARCWPRTPAAGFRAALLVFLVSWAVVIALDARRDRSREPAEDDDDGGWLARLHAAGGERLALVGAGLWDRAAGRSPRPVRDFRTSCPEASFPRGVLGLPAYAYRDALADRSPSNVRDVAVRAAEDRRAFGRTSRSETVVDAQRPGAPAPSPPPNLRRVVATHHKTGTALMHDIFDAIARKYSKKYGPFVDVRAMEDHPEKVTDTVRRDAAKLEGVALDYHLGKALPEFLFDDDGRTIALEKGNHSSSPPTDVSAADAMNNTSPSPPSARSAATPRRAGSGSNHRDDDAGARSVSLPLLRECASLPRLFSDAPGGYRLVHVVRDPADVLVSGFLYHRRLPADERWLFEPAAGLGGRSYADHLAGAGPVEAMAAELGIADDELRMLVLAHRDAARDPNAMNVRLEDFFHDFDATVLRVLRFLRFDEADAKEMVAIAREFDVGRWSDEELRGNEHFTKGENRKPYLDVLKAPGFLNATVAYMRYAMEYRDEWPEET